ncbi:DUF7552 domain-containing protein [Halococcus hamelinensis]|uniref:DUF7552 domain-containing protein n=1 Tax=Halococcus hamelinensis 100A6 TaxID=1132509 RepID=M0LVP4_9EURY|nr:hypothetical protein [Halococcus hamelinensis]EMA36170.1 hypothetical protein C447_15396 [Halococcus hamelinensis 100A6]
MSSHPTLRDIRARLVSLASEDGRYVVVCGRTDARPVPVSGLRFADRATAASGVRVAEAYRAHLRRYDPRLPVHEFVVQETVATDPRGQRRRVPVPVGCEPAPGSDHETAGRAGGDR